MIGIGLRSPHIETILQTLPKIGFLEIHTENYLHEGGALLHSLARLAHHYPLSFHGVALSLGSFDGVDLDHLEKVAHLHTRFQPTLFSEHLAFNRVGNIYLHDLLPIPYTAAALCKIADNIQQVQDKLRRPILIENPSTYIQFNHSEMSEALFLKKLCEKTGAALLLDINNVFVSAFNHGFCAQEYLHTLKNTAIGEYHLAGHSLKTLKNGEQIRIDDHASHITKPVWDLFNMAVALFGARPTLIEWDQHLPPLNILLEEAEKASGILTSYGNTEHARQPASAL